MNAEETAYVKKLENEIVYLKEQAEWFRRQIFGQRSEKTKDASNDRQLLLKGFETLQEESPKEKEEVAAHQRRKQNRHGKDKISLPADLPKERIVLDLSEDEKVCSETGRPLVKIGEEISHKLAHKPGSYYIKEFVRPKYGLPQGEGVCIRDLPDSILPRCRADESLLADILVKKFTDHLPLYRICEGLSRDGISISRQLLSQWVLRIGKALHPLYKKMLEKILESENAFVDESPVDLLIPGKGKTHKAFMWVLVGGKSVDPPYRVFNFRFDRKHKHAADLLKNYRGILHSDKYGAYEKLANQKRIVWCPCWSHVRRKFFESESGNLDFRDWVLRKIRYLFMLERVAWARSEKERLQIR
jgi:transposase